jgi:hypothetical protein
MILSPEIQPGKAVVTTREIKQQKKTKQGARKKRSNE